MDTNNLGELFAALASARQEFGTLTKGKTASIKSEKGSYGYTYADLSDVIEATAAALAKHGLVIIQEPAMEYDGNRQIVVISGCIAHKSGAIYTLRPLALPVAGGTAQAVGSAISYGRRYQLTSVLNLAAADDDGDEASAEQKLTTRPQQAPRLPSAQKAAAPKRTADASTGEIEPADVDFGMDKGTPPHQRLWGIGMGIFGPDWDMARPWIISRWTARFTPDNTRNSSSELSDDEKTLLGDYLNEKASELQRVWPTQKAKLPAAA